MMNRLSLRIPSFCKPVTAAASTASSKVRDLQAKFEDPSAVPAPLTLKKASKISAKCEGQRQGTGGDCESIYDASEKEDLMAVTSPVDETLPSPWEYAQFTRTNPFSGPETEERDADTNKQPRKSRPRLLILTKKGKETEQEMLDRVASEFDEQHKQIQAEEAAALQALADLALGTPQYE